MDGTLGFGRAEFVSGGAMSAGSVSAKPVSVGVVGASGYVGSELLRLVLIHPQCQLTRVCGQSSAGRPLEEVLPSLRAFAPGFRIEAFDADVLAKECDVVFTALPHGQSMECVAALRERGKLVIDLSADFRLDDPQVYAEWYGPHSRPDLLQDAVYGLVELHRGEIAKADLIAVPGCYPTASILALAPLLKGPHIALEGIVIDAKSGVSGAGRSASLSSHFVEVREGIRAYKVGGQHRHLPEMEMALSRVAGRPLRLTFTPHLTPMGRGILSTIYARPLRSAPALEEILAEARALYRDSASVEVLEAGMCPDTNWIRGSNRVHLSYTFDPRTQMLIAQGSIDNLLKGAAGQAMQCLNLRFGWPEGLGLDQPPAWP